MANNKIFYGWFIVAASIIGIASSFSLLVISMTGIFAGPLSMEFGWTSTQIFKGLGLAGMLGVVSAPVIGAASDKIGVRRVLAISFLIEIAILYSFSKMQGSLFAYMVRYSLLALLCMGTTQVVFGRVLASWFHKRLGLALGMALSGVGLGGAFWSRAIQYMIDQYGWRGAYVGMAILIGCITLPIVLLVIRETPAKMGLNVDGDDSEAGLARQAIHESQGITLSEAASTGQYWLMIVVFMMMGMGLQGVSANMVPLMKSTGMSDQLAASTQSNMFLAVVVGRLTSGWLLDRMFAARIAQGFMLMPIVGISALLFGVTGGWAAISAMCVGASIGGEADIFAYMVKRYFGIKHYSRIYGTFFSAFGIAASVGPVATAWGLENIEGGYGRVLWVHVGLLLVAALVLLKFKPYPQEQH